MQGLALQAIVMFVQQEGLGPILVSQALMLSFCLEELLDALVVVR